MEYIKNRLTIFQLLKSGDLQEAAQDFRYLLNRGYPRKAALELVGNRYGLTFDERHLLHRGVFSDADSESRRKKKTLPEAVRNKELAIDGHNVLITIEAGLSDRPLILGDDGFIRDISGLSGSFQKTEMTVQALELLLNVLKRAKPHQTLFLFDSPISRSGELALEVRGRMQKGNLPGDAMAVRVPEKILIGFPGRVATSDTAIIDRSHKVVDLAGYVLSRQKKLKSLIRWRRKRGIVGKQRKS
jgi:hypothetical protein